MLIPILIPYIFFNTFIDNVYIYIRYYSCLFILHILQALHTGPAYLEQWGGPSLRQLQRSLLLNLALLVLLPLLTEISTIDVVSSLVIGYLVFYFVLYQALFRIGKNRLWKYSNALCQNKRNEFEWSSLATGSDASQPSALHQYALMIFDVSQNDILIEGEVDWRDLKYWSLIPYDLYGLPLKQFFNDENSKNFSDSESSFHYKLRITASAPPSRAVSYAEEPHDTLFVGRSDRLAYLMFRIVHPTDPSKQLPKPRVSVINRAKRGSEKKSE
jgi:hypothetical protein